jgi:Condensation domain
VTIPRERLEGLSPADKRALLAKLLREKAAEPKPFPLSFAQERLWFLDQLEPGNPMYNVPVGVALEHDLDPAALAHALGALVERHEALRTRFGVVDGRPVQLVEPALAVELPVRDLRELPDSERRAEAARLAAAEAARPFDLATGPLIRAQLVRLAEASWVLLVTIHHIVSDAWSMGILFGELTELYEARRAGRPPALAELPVQYPDFAAWQRDWLRGAVLDEQLGYWRAQLAGAPALLELPADHPRPAVQSFAGAAHAFEIEPRLAEALRALSRREGATLFMTLLAAFKVLLLRHSGQSDLVVGTPIANRTRAEVEGLIGFFVNTLALRTDLSGDPPFTELLARVREQTLGAYTHQDLPFERLVEELQPERTLSHNPIFQVMFTLQNAGPAPSAGAASDAAAGTGSAQLGNGSAKFDLSLLTVETDNGLLGVFEYTTDLFEAARIERMGEELVSIVDKVVSHPEIRLSELSEALERGEQRAREEEAREFADARRRALAAIQHSDAVR